MRLWKNLDQAPSITTANATEDTFSKAQPKRAPDRYTKEWVAALVVGDIAMFALAFGIAIWVVFHSWIPKPAHAGVFVSTAVSIVLWLYIFERFGLYERSIAFSARDEFYYTVAALCLGVVPQLILFTLVPSISTSRLVILIALGASIVLVGGERGIMHQVRKVVDHRRPQRIAIVGSPERIEAVVEALNVVDGTQLLKLEVNDLDGTFESIKLKERDELCHALDSLFWFRRAREWGCNTLIFTEVPPAHLMPHTLETCARERIKVAMAPPRVRTQSYKLALEVDGHQALIVPTQLGACTPGARLVKRIFDLCVGSVVLIPALPIMGIAALAILLESGRPVLYRQERVGRHGKVFELLKLRSMPVGSEDQTGPTWTVPGDKRATKVGSFLRRTSIDELPQLFNVMSGQMSLVGPRPERPMFVERFREFLPRFDERHLVRPGITGWSHVQMKRNSPISDIGERLSHDLYYIENYSLLMDASIILKTAAEVLFQRAN